MNPSPHDFRMPAEWERHAGTWLTWPHRRSDWPGKFSPIPWVYAEIIRTLTRFEKVNLLVLGQEEEAVARRILNANHADLSNAVFHRFTSDRSWMRDSGPIFVKNEAGERTVLDWHFNAWAKYPDWTQDNQIPSFVTKLRGLPSVRPEHRSRGIVLEGGSIDVNGAGLMLTTEECLMSNVQERNPTFDRSDYEHVFADYLGVEKVLWLNRGIAGDDTHGHVDDLARFVNPNTVVVVVEPNPQDDNYEPLQENLKRLKGMTDTNGKRLNIVPLPMPSPIVFRKQRLPASYANFYIANGVVLVPTFNDRQDRVALGILAELFPDREVVGIHCVDLVWGLGTLHCMTQQEPA